MGGGAGRLTAAFLSRLNKVCRVLSLLAAVIGAFVHWVLPLTVIAPGDEKAPTVAVVSGDDGPTAVYLSNTRGLKKFGLLAAFCTRGVLLSLLQNWLRNALKG